MVFASAGALQGALVVTTKPAYAQTKEARCNSVSVLQLESLELVVSEVRAPRVPLRLGSDLAFARKRRPIDPRTPYDSCPKRFREWRPTPWLVWPGVGLLAGGWAFTGFLAFSLPDSDSRAWPLVAAAPLVGPWLALEELHGADKTYAAFLGVAEGVGLALIASSLLYGQRRCGDGRWLMRFGSDGHGLRAVAAACF